MSDAYVKQLATLEGARLEVSDADVHGLRLRVFESGSKTFSYWYRTKAGDPRRFKIGAYPSVSLAAARKRARILAADVSRGHDPQGEVKAQRVLSRARVAAPTFAELCEDFIADQGETWRPATRAAWTRYLEREIKPAFGKRKADEVTGDDVRALVEKIKRRPAPVSAARCFEVLRRLCSWAVWKKRLLVSPCEQARPFERGRRKRNRRAAAAKAFNNAQLVAIFDASTSTELEHLVALIAHTAVRAHDARAARWEDFETGDPERAVWRVRTHKVSDVTGAPHLVPLTAEALSVVAAIREANVAAGLSASPWLFPAQKRDVKSGELIDLTGPCEVCGAEGHADKPNKALSAVKKAAGIEDRGLLHRFRDTAKTRMSEQGIPVNVSEHALGHVVPGIAGTYDHAELLPQRRAALEWWSGELARIRSTKRSADVVPIRA